MKAHWMPLPNDRPARVPNRHHVWRTRRWLGGAAVAAAYWMALVQADAQFALIPRGAEWEYLDAGTNLPAAWPSIGFDDSLWPGGPAPLGYGVGDLTTVIDTAQQRPVTTYFRHTFTNWASIRNLTVRIRRNDGAVIYLNGEEKIRSQMPSGPVDATTGATARVPAEEETNYVQYGIFVWYLPSGPNTVAVEVHQAVDGTNDCSLDLELIANLPIDPPTITWLNPTNGAVFAEGETIILSTAPHDSDGHVQEVRFYANDAWIGSAATPPFSLAWSNAPPGRHILYAVARDNHNRTSASSKVHIQIGGDLPDRLVRGPYLQMGTSTSMVVRWRTDWFKDSRVTYGTAPDDLAAAVVDPTPALDHEITLTGLQPNTRYYYSVGASAGPIASGPFYQFVTVPTQPGPVRIWVMGDTRSGDANQLSVRDAYEWFFDDARTDVWLHLGDLSGSGTDEQLQSVFFNVYSNQLQRWVCWPTRGNHEADLAYFDVFTLPTEGQAGGVPSGSESYYAFDYANIHFVVLDSSYSDRSAGGAMYDWLQEDLSEHTNQWLIAYWHAPPYTKGSHDSDYESECIVMRTSFLPILESFGVDLVLSGHSHAYERSYLLNGHYGSSWTILPEMILDSGPGPYRKLPGPNQGAVYVVGGSSGVLECGPFEHPAMRLSKCAPGSLVLEVDGNTLQGKFLRDTGQIDDTFTIVKVDPDANPRLTSIVWTMNTVALTWECIPKHLYRVSWCEQLDQPWWTIAQDLQTNGFVMSWVHNLPSAARSGFYRVERTAP